MDQMDFNRSVFDEYLSNWEPIERLTTTAVAEILVSSYDSRQIMIVLLSKVKDNTYGKSTTDEIQYVHHMWNAIQDIIKADALIVPGMD